MNTLDDERDADSSGKLRVQYVLVDIEAAGVTPFSGKMTEFGAVKFHDRSTFHGELYNTVPDVENPAVPVIVSEQLESFENIMERFRCWLDETAERHVFISDNPAYDFMWIADAFDRAGMKNPFGFSGRRIGDLYAGAVGNFKAASNWKRYRKTTHDHNPVNDSLGNAEALETIFTKFDLKH